MRAITVRDQAAGMSGLTLTERPYPHADLNDVIVTTGLTVGQRVFGLTDWSRDGSLAEYTAVEARNLAPELVRPGGTVGKTIIQVA